MTTNPMAQTPLRADTLIPIASARAVARALICPQRDGLHAYAFDEPSFAKRARGRSGKRVETLLLRRSWTRPVERISWQLDAAMQVIVGTWPQRFESVWDSYLGVRSDTSADEIRGYFIEDCMAVPAPSSSE